MLYYILLKKIINTFVMAPTMINMLLAHSVINNFNLSSLRFLGHGGSLILEDLLNRAMKRLKCQFDDKWGKVVIAVEVCKEGKSLSKENIIAFSRERLTTYKCPKFASFMESLPKSGSGKVLKKS